MVYYKEFIKHSDYKLAHEKAKIAAQDSLNIQNYYSALGQTAKMNPAIKQAYYQGWTVKSDRMVGGVFGLENRILKP